jgi:hypothetical protein
MHAAKREVLGAVGSFNLNMLQKGRAIKVIRKVRWLGGEFGQFDPDTARNQ